MCAELKPNSKSKTSTKYLYPSLTTIVQLKLNQIWKHTMHLKFHKMLTWPRSNKMKKYIVKQFKTLHQKTKKKQNKT